MDVERRTRGGVSSRLMIEALVAAGSRKSPEEYSASPELCKDAAGYLTLDEHVVFWVCDGTSDSNALPRHLNQPGFNSRILASDLGQGFGRIAAEALLKGEDPRASLPKELFDDIVCQWRGRLIEYLRGIENEGKLTALLTRLPLTGDGAYRMKWSSTLLGGIYNERGRALDILNIGDCGAVVMGEEPHKVLPRATCGIVVANIRADTELDVNVFPIEVKADWEHFESVTCFFAMSDGLAKDLGAFLSETEENLKNMPLGDVRRRLMTAGTLTYDDRAVVIGTLLEKCEETGESNARAWLETALVSVRRAFTR